MIHGAVSSLRSKPIAINEMSLERETHELSNNMSPDSQNLPHFPKNDKTNKKVSQLFVRSLFYYPKQH